MRHKELSAIIKIAFAKIGVNCGLQHNSAVTGSGTILIIFKVKVIKNK